MRSAWSPQDGNRRTTAGNGLLVAAFLAAFGTSLVLLAMLGSSTTIDDPPIARPAVAMAAAAASPGTPTTGDLEREKLEQEIRKLENENAKASGVLGWTLAFAPFITVLVAVGSLAGTLYKQSKDVAEARRAADEESRRWRADFQRQQQIDAEAAYVG